MASEPQVIMARAAVEAAIESMATSILEQVADPRELALVGIHRGGVPLAARLAQVLRTRGEFSVPLGSVDIAFYRDDAAIAGPDPKIGPSEVEFDVAGRDIVLVDDVLQTGRTVRAAIDCLLDFGRPRRVWLAVLCDRGGRELPIAADFVGQSVHTRPGARLEVNLTGPDVRVVLA